MTAYDQTVLRLIADVIGDDDIQAHHRLRTDLKIDGDDGWILFQKIGDTTSAKIDRALTAQIFHDEADMVLHRVLLRAIGFQKSKLTRDMRVSELIAAANEGRAPVPET